MCEIAWSAPLGVRHWASGYGGISKSVPRFAVASLVGALLAIIGLMLLAPMSAGVAFLFGPAEHFALYLLAPLKTLNITPGPTLFSDRSQVIWGLTASLLIAKVVLLLMNVPLMKIYVKILTVVPWVLLPGVTMISFVGSYSRSGSYFDLLLMGGLGALAMWCASWISRQFR